MYPKLLSLTSSEVERILKTRGFYLSRIRGSHQQFVGHVRDQKRRVTVISNQKRFTPKTIASMINQSGLNEDEWLASI
jgi:predicted RNA binding protein YcfA (HicA-like mRNA interferase family)